jgi:hypothetical protein
MDGTAPPVHPADMSDDTPAPDTPGDVAKDDQRARFRAALDRKAGRHVDQAGHHPAAMHPHTAPAKPQKAFRRKSG